MKKCSLMHAAGRDLCRWWLFLLGLSRAHQETANAALITRSTKSCATARSMTRVTRSDATSASTVVGESGGVFDGDDDEPLLCDACELNERSGATGAADDAASPRPPCTSRDVNSADLLSVASLAISPSAATAAAAAAFECALAESPPWPTAADAAADADELAAPTSLKVDDERSFAIEN